MDFQENQKYQQSIQSDVISQGPYDSNSQPMSVKDWLITLLIFMIPVVNIVMYFVWAFGSDVNINKKNYCKAGLILFAIFAGLSIIIAIFLSIIAAVTVGTIQRAM